MVKREPDTATPAGIQQAYPIHTYTHSRHLRSLVLSIFCFACEPARKTDLQHPPRPKQFLASSNSGPIALALHSDPGGCIDEFSCPTFQPSAIRLHLPQTLGRGIRDTTSLIPCTTCAADGCGTARLLYVSPACFGGASW